jgi:hypothetical protein
MPRHVVWNQNTHLSETLVPVFRAEERQCTLQKMAACYSERLVPIKQTRGLTQTGSMNEQLKHVNGVSALKTGPCRSWAVHITLGIFVSPPSEYFSPFSLSLALNSTDGR